MDTDVLIDVIAAQSVRALAALTRAGGGNPVPTTPDWTAADLTWHLAEVQWFWGTIVEDLLLEPDPSGRPPRPQEEALPAFLAQQSERLVAALRHRDPADRCYSWYDSGWSVGWVARRQAHEALIHRVDAELAAGLQVTDADPDLADDGIDEMLEVMMQLPAWGTFTPDRVSVRVAATDTGSVRTLLLGRFAGTSPDSGADHDIDAARLVADEGPVQVTTPVSGPAWDLDRWLWGRLDTDAVLVEGDLAGAERLRAAAQVD
ncbi:MAG TPA: maleylpyruvate isomerase family mycothiol-dependent enzyme [Euzebya sp.]|nr:maleylpyruvate isomerase family mycothiol-dependent enzyme [Euzebya sp.]